MSEEVFEREKAAFEHNAAQMRALNEQMNRVPTLSVTLTGGLWFAAGQVPSLELVIKFWLLLFAGFANLGLVLVAYRIRDVMQSYLEKIEAFCPTSFADGHPKEPILPNFAQYSMISVLAGLMACAALMSFLGAFFFYWPQSTSHRSIGIILFLLVAGAMAVLLLRRKGPQSKS